MLKLHRAPNSATCDGMRRRDFLTVGSLGAAGLSLPTLLQSRAAAAETGAPVHNTSVVWLWLGGGPTHVETFDPKMTAPVEYRSVVGEVSTSLPGVTIGGLFPNMARVADHMVYVRSFAHGNSGHSGGTHWVMTGYNHPPADSGDGPIKPSLGSIAARTRGPSNPHTGIPTYVRLQGTYADGASWLGTAYSPFDSGGEARRNMELKTDITRFDDRRGLLRTLDRMERRIDRSGTMDGLDSFEKQAFDVVLGKSKEAYDLNHEDPRTRDRYGAGLGENLLLARRLCEAGCGFVSMHYGGWDMHGGIESALNGRCPQMDQAVAAFIEDVEQRGLSENILLVITGEFGRTPRINGSAGRDHWAPLSTLALAHGRINNGLVVGESSDNAEVPKSAPVGPQDLMATVFHHLGVDQKLHLTDSAGRPTPMVSGGRVIPGLA